MNIRVFGIAVLLIAAATLSVRIAQELGLGPLVLFLLGSLTLWISDLCLRKKRHLISALLLAVSLSMLFLATVHRIDKQFVCKECLAGIGTREYFVLGFSQLAETHVENNFAALVATDLGFPCSHKNLEYIRQVDCYGTFFCRHSGHSGTIGLTEDLTWYDADRSKVVAAFGPC